MNKNVYGQFGFLKTDSFDPLETDSGSGMADDEIDDIDECAQNSYICGVEAGCYNTPGSYKCLCSDLEVMDPIYGCFRNAVPDTNTTNLDVVITDVYLPHPTEGTFHYPQLRAMLDNHNSSTNQGSEGNTFTTNSSSSHLHPSPIITSHPTVLFGCLVVLAVMVISSLVVCIWKKRHAARWPLICLGRKPSQAPSAGSLSKIMQQYVTNPNYYSNSPDAPLLKMMRDIEISRDNLSFLEEIGEGCFGKVHKGFYTQPTGDIVPVAIKILKDGATSEAQNDFEREVEIMSTFNHENIITLVGVVMKDTGSTPWMVFEYMQYGDLAELLRSNSPCLRIPPEYVAYQLNQPDLVWIATQISNGMVYLSSQHFVHRDLATRNCLVGENLIVKISDFGMSRDIYTCDYYKIGGSRMLPVRWMAPESIMHGKFTLESDVWSYGVVLWEIFTYGKQPYYGHSNEEVVKLILQGILLSPPEDCPSFIYSIMAGCWKTEPRDRLSFEEIFQHLVDKCPDHQPGASLDPQPDQELLDADNYLVPNVPFVTVV
ncbi:tyrosine-protein kinase transmembrane receptor Ror-like [Tachypleus tridentatus]|uniref:tyrosine-protein kinase transmembrane receptor Ror-like n=1 Tax=Tachypleus tridentatus TaxID=6853 RepID=UPI003FCFAED2